MEKYQKDHERLASDARNLRINIEALQARHADTKEIETLIHVALGAEEFNAEGMKQLKSNYDWVCKRLAEVENKDKPDLMKKFKTKR